MNKKFNTWIISEGIAGTENQCLGVAEALGAEPTVLRIGLNQPWKALSPYLGLEQSWSFSPRLPEKQWPDLVIAGGRKAIAPARYIKKRSPDTFVTFLQDPRVNTPFDLIAVPEHDPLRGENVIVTTASPNRITPQKLEAAKATFPQFEALPAPRVAVLIGGSSAAYTMTPQITKQLAEQLSTLDAGLIITASRRTGAENESILRAALTDDDTFFWDGAGENPYFAILAYADIILVTADSASMLSEAASTGKPVYRIDLEGGSKRINALHHNLEACGAVHPFTGVLKQWTYEPLNDAQRVANVIKDKMKL